MALLPADRLGRNHDRGGEAMITQALITVALGCLSGLISGSVAFLAMRVFPVIYGKTGIDGWIERRTGFGLSTGIIWLFGVVTRSWVGLYFGILFYIHRCGCIRAADFFIPVSSALYPDGIV
jgi:hypothetical protein